MNFPSAMLSLSPDYLPGKVWAAHGERLQKRRHCSIWTRSIQVSMFVPLLGLCSSIWTFQISMDCSYSLQIQKKTFYLIDLWQEKCRGAYDCWGELTILIFDGWVGMRGWEVVKILLAELELELAHIDSISFLRGGPWVTPRSGNSFNGSSVGGR